jgi:pimeloyl-ACP methyl ester carboxylesterase
MRRRIILLTVVGPLTVWHLSFALADHGPADCGAAGEHTEEVKTGYAHVNGAKFYYEELGTGPALVMVHGGYIDRRMWDDQFEVFAEHFRVIRYDARRHGLTKARPGPYSDHDDLRALLKHLGIEKACVMGLSLGGRIVIDFATAYPEMVAALIPVAPGISGWHFDSPEMAAYMSELRAAYRSGDADSIVEVYQRAWTDGPKRKPEQVDPKVRERVRVMAHRSVSIGRGDSRSGLPDPPATESIGKIRAPTLVVVGDLDMPVIYQIVDLLVSEIPGAQRAVIPGAAHMVNMEKPAEFNKVVLEFLSENSIISRRSED